MPRLLPSLFHQAYNISPHAAALLPACRTIPAALNELRWIRQDVSDRLATARTAHGHFNKKGKRHNLLVARACRLRGSGVPLQYVLGTVPFGDLILKCQRDVLIPRNETEAYTLYLATLIKNDLPTALHASQQRREPLRILDICTGTGCIALLLASLLNRPSRACTHSHSATITGIDISPSAITLAQQNRQHNLPAHPGLQHVKFIQGDVFSAQDMEQILSHGNVRGQVDVLVCNPPYISTADYARVTARSVRNHEPKNALVPLSTSTVTTAGSKATTACSPEDIFYARVLDIALREMSIPPRKILLEVGDMAQAKRVVDMALRYSDEQSSGGVGKRRGQKMVVEVWRDWPDATPFDDEEQTCHVAGKEVQVRGSGHGRSVYIQCV